MTEDQLTLRRGSIESLVLTNRLFLFVSRRLQEYQESKLDTIVFVINLLGILIFTILAYAGINYALFKIDPSQFASTEGPGLFLFFYYSFRAFTFPSTAEITPVQTYSRVLLISEQSFAIILGTILVTLFVSVRSERYKEQLAKTIRDIEDVGKVFERMLLTRYQLTIEQAIAEVERLQSGPLLRFIQR